MGNNTGTYLWRRITTELASRGYIDKGPGRLPSVKKSGSANKILVLFPREEYFDSVIFAKIYEGVIEEAARHSLVVEAVSPFYFKTRQDYSTAMIVIPQCIPQDDEVQAVIKERSAKVVCAHSLHPLAGGISTVRPNLKKAAELVLGHLLGKGYAPVAYVGDRDGGQWMASRFEAYHEAMQARDSFSLNYVKECSLKNGASVKAALSELLALPRPPKAIFATNDVLAITLLEACRDLDVCVPEEIAIAGFDNTLESALSSPPLTTVDTKWKDLGRCSVRMLLEMEAGDLEDKLVEPELIARQSA